MLWAIVVQIWLVSVSVSPFLVRWLLVGVLVAIVCQLRCVCVCVVVSSVSKKKRKQNRVCSGGVLW